MIKIDTSKMESRIKNNIETPFIVKTSGNSFYMCVNEDRDKLKLISLQNGYIQSPIYYTFESLLSEGYEIYSGTLSITEKLA